MRKQQAATEIQSNKRKKSIKLDCNKYNFIFKQSVGELLQITYMEPRADE